MASIVVLWAITFLTAPCHSEDALAPENVRLLAPIRVLLPHAGPGGINKEVVKWGFIDGIGKLVIPAEWDSALSFHEGRARVKKGNQEGFIDPVGKLIFELPSGNSEPLNDMFSKDFSEGLVAIEKNKKWGFLDKYGKVVVDFQWDFVLGFSDGLAAVELNRKWCFIDSSGKVVIPSSPEWEQTRSFHDGFAIVEKSGPNGEYIKDGVRYGKGYTDKTGKVVSPCQWSWAGAFSDGLARVSKDDAKGTSMNGFIDKTGKAVLSLNYYNFGDFSEGLADAQKVSEGKWGFIDTNGKMVIAPRWKEVGPFSSGLAKVVDESNHTGFTDRSGEVVIPLIWDGAWAFDGDICWVHKYTGHGIRYAVIDRTGKVLILPEWEEIKIHGDYCFARRTINPVQGEECAWFNKTGKMIWSSGMP